MSNQNKTNVLNLLGGAFISADEGIELTNIPAEGLAFKLMSATGSKLVDEKLMLSKSGQYYVAKLTTKSGDTCWLQVPTDYPIGWTNHSAWVLVQPEPDVMSAEQYHILFSK